MTVAHLPPGTSKWNRIEHRLFCHITQNWRAKPLTSRLAVVELIAKGKLPVGKLITHRFKLDEINEAFDVAQEKERTGAVFVAISIE